MSWDWEKLKQQQQGKGTVPPQMDEVIDKIKKFKLPGGPIVVVVFILVVLAFTSVFTVKQNEVGVVQFFGRYVRTAQPGLNFKLPFGIEQVRKVNVREYQTEEFGVATARYDTRGRMRSGSDNLSVALMLTGDLNVGLVPWIVQYRVKDPYNYLFKVRDVRRLLVLLVLGQVLRLCERHHVGGLLGGLQRGGCKLQLLLPVAAVLCLLHFRQ